MKDPFSLSEERPKEADEEKASRDLSWSHVMRSSDGVLVLREVLSWCGVYRTSFVPGATDATAYREGMRSVGLRLLARMTDADSASVLDVLRPQDAAGRVQ